ncbi:MAG: isoleucine--tRNA ligase [Candidatus Altiarchaeota archaeon]
MVNAVGDYKPRELEEMILDHWRRHHVMEETLKRRKGDSFNFLEGPPTANAPPALHHVEVRTFKDAVNRFQYMQGRSVPRKAGWDCHGLPVEVQVEKELKLANKKDIVEYGVDKFVEKCRTSVFSHIREWDTLTERMGYWVDLKDPYVTMDNGYIESVWWSLKKLWDLEMLYEGYRVVPFCPRCGTPLSSHEVALGYQTVKDETVIVAFRSRKEDYSLLAWTTTPWTLLSNVALAVHPGITYAKIKYKGERYVLAKDLAMKRFPEADIEAEFKGKELIGVEYHPIFSHFNGKLHKPAWRVIAGDFVSTEEGTGIVHIAPAFGEDDYNAGAANNLPVVNPVNQEGEFTEDIPELKGTFVKDADPKIIDWLDEMGVLIAKYPYEHEYPFCWRCKKPLIYYAMKSWFIKVSDVRQKLLEKNGEIRWFPESIGAGRFGNWLENAKDWSLSRNRFWGTPLPIWRCECGRMKAIGSRKELEDNAVCKVDPKLDLHRPYVDEVKLKCVCGKEMNRVEYVIDCWYDSGAAAFAQYHYPFENKELFEESFPYDFICEATDQTRGWFYTLLVLGALLFDKPAYWNCVVGGLLLDDKGEKMSKSKNNIVDPWELFNTVGADAVRLQMCSTAPWNVKRFGKDSMNEAVIPMLRTLWNCYSFTVRYMLLDKYDPSDRTVDKKHFTEEDWWITSAANQMGSSVHKAMEGNEYHHVVAALNEFIVEDLSRWYIKLIRDRLWLEDRDGRINPSKKAAYVTLTEVFEKVCLALAPMAPFITEEIYLNLLKGDAKSIHHMGWPSACEDVDEELIRDMTIARAIFESGSKCRQDAKIKLRHPITKVTISGNGQVEAAVKRLTSVIAKQLNCKGVEYVPALKNVTYQASPNFKEIGPRYGKEAGKVAQAIKSKPQEAKRIKESGKAGKIDGHEITPEMIADIRMIIPETHAAADFACGSSSGLVMIETKRDQSLMNEALARDLIRHVQELRKKADLPELKRIMIEVTKDEDIGKMLKEQETAILYETRADQITLKEGLESKDRLEYEGKEIKYRITH